MSDKWLSCVLGMKTLDDVPQDIFCEEIFCEEIFCEELFCEDTFCEDTFFEDAFREDTFCKKKTFAQTNEGRERRRAKDTKGNVFTSEDRSPCPLVRTAPPPPLLLLLLCSCLLPLAAAPCPTPCSCLWRR